MLHNILIASGGIAPHQLAEDAIGREGVLDGDADGASLLRIERRLAKLIRRHLTKPLEARDLGLHILWQLGKDLIALIIVERPIGLFTCIDPIERRLRDIDMPAPDELGQHPIKEGEQERRDMMAVAIGVHQEEDPAIAELRDIEIFSSAAAERAHDILKLAVAGDLRGRRALGVQDFAAEREDRLKAPIAAHLRVAARRITLDQEEL